MAIDALSTLTGTGYIRRVTMLLPVMILSAAVLCFSEEKCEVTALKVQKPISIDGILSDPAW